MKDWQQKGEQVTRMQFPKHDGINRDDNQLLQFLRKNDMPIGIEEFISRKESPTTRNVFKLESPIRFAEEKDISQLIQLNNQVYKGYYPYRDMLDVEYVSEFTSPTKDHGFISVYETDDNKEIGGFLLLGVDHEQRKGYFRGLMVSPKHRNRLHLKNRVLESAYQGYKQYFQHVEMWYGETRTAHTIGQKWMEETGSRPFAFFPNKDIFDGSGIRESDILEIAYNQKALYEYRNTEIHLLPQFNTLYTHIAQIYGFSAIQTTICPKTLSVSQLSEAHIIAKQCHINEITRKYNTSECTIQTPNGSTLEFLVNNSLASAEKTSYHVSSLIELTVLLLCLKNYIIHKNLEYFEIYVPTTNVQHQQVFLELGFSCFGYVPSWMWNNNHLDDCLVFGLYHSPINWNSTHLTENSATLIELLEPFLHEF